MRQIWKLKEIQKWKYKIISENGSTLNHTTKKRIMFLKNEGLDSLEFYSILILANPDRQIQVFSVKSSKF